MNLFDNQILEVILRSIISLIILFIMTRLLGKRQVSQLTLFDYVIGISIGNFASEMSINLEANMLNSAVAVIVFGLCAFVISYSTMKSIFLRNVITGFPTVLMQHGEFIYKNLKTSKFDINDFLQQSRSNGYFDLSEIEYAILEPNGKISFMPKNLNRPVTIKDMKIKPEKQGLCANVIIDGNIMKAELKNINKNEKWLKEKLDNNILSEILLATVDINNKLTIYKKNIDEKELQILQ